MPYVLQVSNTHIAVVFQRICVPAFARICSILHSFEQYGRLSQPMWIAMCGAATALKCVYFPLIGASRFTSQEHSRRAGASALSGFHSKLY